MRGLIFQHMPGEDAGLFARLLPASNIAYHVVETHLSSELPPSEEYDFLIVLGGVQQAWETDKYPWLEGEIDFIRRWVRDEKKPYFGLCLGHQLLAQALGGQVSLAQQEELGFPEIQLNEHGLNHPLMRDIPASSHWLQWHSAEVKTVPAGLEVLASSTHCAVQAMAGPEDVVSFQFHAEATPGQISRWTAQSKAKDSMHGLYGADEVARVISEADQHLENAMAQASAFFARWLKLVRE